MLLFKKISTEKYIYERKSFNLKSVKTDWKGFHEKLDAEYHQFLSHGYASYPTHPKKKSVNKRTHKNPVLWWDAECSDMQKRLRRACFKKWRFTNKLIVLIEYEKDAILHRASSCNSSKTL